MGWYLRTSVRMGPVRWNLSKSGIGMSVGVRGLRVGTGPRGSYVTSGRGGLYFGQRIGTSTRTMYPSQRRMAAPSLSPTPASPSSALMEYLPETEVTHDVPASADALAHYIATQCANIAVFPWALTGLIILNLVILGNVWPHIWQLAILFVPLSAYGAHYLYHWDRQRTHVVLHYDLDTQEHRNFAQLCTAVAGLGSIARLQRVEARQVHGDWKHQAGATTALKLAPISVLPPGRIRWLETNVPVWGIQWRQGGIMLAFLPDRVIIQQRRAVAVLPYADVHVTTTVGRFVESGAVPRDAQLLGYNWQYPNTSGGPDRRFKHNRQLPVTEATSIGLQSASGLSLAIQASNRQQAEAFVTTLRSYVPLLCTEPPITA